MVSRSRRFLSTRHHLRLGTSGHPRENLFRKVQIARRQGQEISDERVRQAYSD
jgi:hypothetical protein